MILRIQQIQNGEDLKRCACTDRVYTSLFVNIWYTDHVRGINIVLRDRRDIEIAWSLGEAAKTFCASCIIFCKRPEQLQCTQTVFRIIYTALSSSKGEGGVHTPTFKHSYGHRCSCKWACGLPGFSGRAGEMEVSLLGRKWAATLCLYLSNSPHFRFLACGNVSMMWQ